ncbi:MAG: argininosuccinate lyase [Sphaerochaeta sp.]
MNYLPETYSELRVAVYTKDGRTYPGKALVTMELRPGYDRAKAHMIGHMLTINEAHLIMLIEQEIVSLEDGLTILKALLAIDYDEYRTHQYTGQFEDLFFELEDEIIRRSKGLGGNLHLARSRNDMCLALARMVVRTDFLQLIEKLSELQNTIALFAKEHANTLYVVHTHTQHAQPGLLGHYFLGVVDMIDRDLARMHLSYQSINRSPMGAAAITTTGFPISRERVAELSGFRGFIENSFDAIGNCDFFTETASSISLCALNLGRVVTDLVTWATEELDMIRVADGYISTSSIMPQKRNPIALEHLRSSLSIVKGLADTVSLAFMKSPYGDISDYEDVEEHMARSISLLISNLELLNSVMATLEVNTELLEKRAQESFSVVTEMADTLYREYGVSFRQAHHLVSVLVKKADALGITVLNIKRPLFAETFEEVIGRTFTQDFTPIQESLDPLHFVCIRDVVGGTGPQAMKAMVVRSKEKIKSNLAWIADETNYLQESDALRLEIISKLMKTSKE